MNKGGYDPAKHHRRSIRLKGHDYAGGGLYFVTICAHRKAGDIFAPPEVKAMVERVVVGAGLVPALPAHPEDRYSVMPDHFHALVEIEKGLKSLGDVIGAFKSLVVHEYIGGVKAGRFAPFPGKIWHRNYFEKIVRDAAEEERISHYIRMNPWKLIQEGRLEGGMAGGMSGTHEGSPYRAIGNPALLHLEKIGMLCSRNCPADALAAACQRAAGAKREHCLIGGFHSAPEKAILDALLKSDARLICCPAWGIDEMGIPAEWLPALEANRMMILEIGTHGADLASAQERNAFVMGTAEKLWMPHVSPHGMLARQVVELGVHHKIIRSRPA
jgi:putative transposase